MKISEATTEYLEKAASVLSPGARSQLPQASHFSPLSPLLASPIPQSWVAFNP